ncbi:hypothetical protein HPB50_005701 [Hyalomma asiaticum]|uniref:Uncharacterized protein n=1 Tax=Hyalomma asiaticum TaxID=266040 RepID=A0ACB7T1D5_HYAAI|nr:hypothetical protein HPB50_005701 [Hyalomma asiaticum]
MRDASVPDESSTGSQDKITVGCLSVVLAMRPVDRVFRSGGPRTAFRHACNGCFRNLNNGVQGTVTRLQ